jgi:hypothetical protein
MITKKSSSESNETFFSEMNASLSSLESLKGRRAKMGKVITINILLFLKVRDFRILCGKIS